MLHGRDVDPVKVSRVDWYVERAFPPAPRGVGRLAVYRMGRRYARSGLTVPQHANGG